jgi:hypothetical protein
LIDNPIVSGFWSRLRLRLRPSEASNAASKALQISAGRRDGNEFLLGGFMTLRKNLHRPVFPYRYYKGVASALGASVSLFDSGHVEIDAREIVQKNLGGRTALK